MDAITPHVKERPILMNAHDVRGILEGRKTQMRRIFKGATGNIVNMDGALVGKSKTWLNGDMKLVSCPYGQPGDRLWVRETFTIENDVDGMGKPPFVDGRPIKHRDESDWECNTPSWQQAHYKATDPAPDLCCDNEKCRQCRDQDCGPHWKPSVHMPRWASRITLEIVSVRVERLQAISEDDAKAHGFQDYLERFNVARSGSITWYASYAFGEFWRRLHGVDSWKSNPWVWVIGFKRVDA